MKSQILRALISISLATAAVHCGTATIANTEVPDTPDNHKVIDFCEKYRKALEARDVDTLVSMASETHYYETGGNAKNTDDIDYNGLHKFFEEQFKKTKSIRYEIKYRNVRTTENGVICVDITYTGSYLIPGPGDKDDWHRQIADHQFRIIVENGTYKFISGM